MTNSLKSCRNVDVKRGKLIAKRKILMQKDALDRLSVISCCERHISRKIVDGILTIIIVLLLSVICLVLQNRPQIRQLPMNDLSNMFF